MPWKSSKGDVQTVASCLFHYLSGLVLCHLSCWKKLWLWTTADLSFPGDGFRLGLATWKSGIRNIPDVHVCSGKISSTCLNVWTSFFVIHIVCCLLKSHWLIYNKKRRNCQTLEDLSKSRKRTASPCLHLTCLICAGFSDGRWYVYQTKWIYLNNKSPPHDFRLENGSWVSDSGDLHGTLRHRPRYAGLEASKERNERQSCFSTSSYGSKWLEKWRWMKVLCANIYQTCFCLHIGCFVITIWSKNIQDIYWKFHHHVFFYIQQSVDKKQVAIYQYRLESIDLILMKDGWILEVSKSCTRTVPTHQCLDILYTRPSAAMNNIAPSCSSIVSQASVSLGLHWCSHAVFHPMLVVSTCNRMTTERYRKQVFFCGKLVMYVIVSQFMPISLLWF